jgi:hypothetical protein
VDCDLSCLFNLKYSPKDFVCGFVSAAAFPPALDNPDVVAEDLEMLLTWLAYKAAK